MSTITEAEFSRIVSGIWNDREQIQKFNVNAAPDEVLLWMLLGCLISYLNLSELETPCFPGAPDAETYRIAISSVLQYRMKPPFDADKYLLQLTGKTS